MRPTRSPDARAERGRRQDVAADVHRIVELDPPRSTARRRRACARRAVRPRTREREAGLTMAEPGGDAEALWYFAYGSNMSPGTFVDRRRMRPLATRWGWLAGYRLSFDLPIGPGERGCASVTAAPDARVAGVLCQHAEADQLDPQTHYRHILVGSTQTGRRIPFTYQTAVSQPGRRPSRHYLDLILDGARTHALPPTPSHGSTADLASTSGARRARRSRAHRALLFTYEAPRHSKNEHTARRRDRVARYGDRLQAALRRARRRRQARRHRLLFARAVSRRAYHDLAYAARFATASTSAVARDRADRRADRPRACAVRRRARRPTMGRRARQNHAHARTDGIGECPSFVFRGQVFSGAGAIASLVRAIRSAVG
jgi:hypothetical protein